MIKKRKLMVIQYHYLIYRLYSIYDNCPNDILHIDGQLDRLVDEWTEKERCRDKTTSGFKSKITYSI